MKRALFAAVFALVGACAPPFPCPDCCPAGDPGSERADLRCRLVLGDGGPAAGVSARCVATDGGGITDSTGTFVFTANVRTCGIAAGSVDCGEVRFLADGGQLSVSFERDAGAAPVYSSSLTGTGACTLFVR